MEKKSATFSFAKNAKIHLTKRLGRIRPRREQTRLSDEHRECSSLESSNRNCP